MYLVVYTCPKNNSVAVFKKGISENLLETSSYRYGPAYYAQHFTYYAMLHCSKFYLLCSNNAQALCLISHVLLINLCSYEHIKWLKHSSKCM